ncbi:Hypothetical predicted protein, partial [Paramuricea clavata]
NIFFISGARNLLRAQKIKLLVCIFGKQLEKRITLYYLTVMLNSLRGNHNL